MGAPLRSRSSFTCAAEMFVVVSVLILLSFYKSFSIYNILTRVALRLTRAINLNNSCGEADLRAEPPASKCGRILQYRTLSSGLERSDN